MNEKKQPAPQPARPSSRPQQMQWSVLEQQVARMQMQITQACQRGDRQAVHSLQQRLMESEAARLLAVHKAAEENQGKHTAGVDGVKSLSQSERVAMAALIHPRHWKQQLPMPVRRVWMPKPGTTERRPLAILPMIDRCKQALVKLALEPEWETQFEPHSYGFRPGRGTHDAIAAILVAIEGRPTYVFDADIEGAFDHVNQAAVLEKLQTYPALKNMIKAWLGAGVMDGDNFIPTKTGIAQGGVLSPLLMNVALHGMEAIVAGGSGGEQPLLVRYADDFVILHSNLSVLQQAIRRVKRWLGTLGLQVHANKTRITHTLISYEGQVGFDFLGFHIHQEQAGRNEARGAQPHRVKTIIAPSQEAVRRHMAVLDQKLAQLQMAPQAQVIKTLNPIIAGWATYYSGVVPAATLSQFDEMLEQRLLRWAGKRHPGKAREWLLNRYWQPVGRQQRVFATHDRAQLRAYRLVGT
ncbi:MAG TPA: reverse transcriptase domain-containing protein [Ktedonobacteraceae bacterium]|jgi:RNA-directed DNA polymerase|nr:reverse transcriptase domain-containing protein [Ktedonobacteraceae bacterium]